MNGDVTIVGSGINGSIMALVLRQLGYHVRLVDRQSHPRFSIGESSTPYADLVLRSLGHRYGLPDLHTLSRYGLWRHRYPHLEGGSKQGFVYFPPTDPVRSSTGRWRGGMVIASSRNRHQGDSNWVRSSLDHHLHHLCLESGIECIEPVELVSAHIRNNVWTLHFQEPEGTPWMCKSDFLIDATGSGILANRLFGFPTEHHGFKTHSSAMFTHADSLPGMESILTDQGIETGHYPFPVDDSAMHHLTEQGWFWSLRFDDGRTSIGQLTDLNEYTAPLKPDSIDAWTRSPSFPIQLKKQLTRASLHAEPGKIIQTGRLQRRLSRAAFPGWIALPSTFGFTDPMHSTGLAWSLHGIEWVARQFEDGFPDAEALNHYEQNLSLELNAVDMLVSTAYRTRRDPVTFELSIMLFFMATVVAEQRRILSPDRIQGFLATDHDPLWKQIRQSVSELMNESGTKSSIHQRDEWFRHLNNRFQTWNNVGLFDASAQGVYQHTAPDIIE